MRRRMEAGGAAARAGIARSPAARTSPEELRLETDSARGSAGKEVLGLGRTAVPSPPPRFSSEGNSAASFPSSAGPASPAEPAAHSCAIYASLLPTQG